MKDRRKAVLQELGLIPVWRHKKEATLTKCESDVNQAVETTQMTEPDEKRSDDRSARIARMDWAALKASVASCTACPLSQSRTQTVFGVGDEQADWLFIGEGPGAKEDELGEPFVGQAGKLLDNMLMSIQLRRGERVYITNIVKCRPPNNRNPESFEAEQCHPYLARQIVLIKPKLIVALGKVAAQNLLHSSESIASLRGKLHYYETIPVIVTYHPAYLLRSLADKAKAWEDLCFARETMQSLSAHSA